MNKILIFLFIAFPISLVSQTPAEQFYNHYSEQDYEKACNIGVEYTRIARNGSDDSQEIQQTMFGYSAYACYLSGDYSRAAECAGYVLDWVNYFGHKDDEVAVSAMFSYSTYLGYDGSFEKALEVQNQASIYTERLGNKIQMLQMRQAKAGILHQAGSFEQARQEYNELYKKAKEILQPTDSMFAVIANSASAFYTMQGYFKEAEVFFLEAMESMKKAKGINSSEYLTAANSTGEFYIYAGWYEHAGNIFKDMLPVTAKVFGKKSADYATNLNNLAVSLEKQEKYSEALKVYDECLKLKEKVWKKESDYYALTLTNVSVVHQAMGNTDLATATLQEALNIYEKLSDADPVNYAMTLNNSAYTFASIGNFNAATDLQNKALTILEKAYGKESKEYASMLSNLAQMYSQMGKYDLAFQVFEKTIAIQKRILGENHPEYGTTINNRANLLIELGDYNAAEADLTEAMRVHNISSGVPNAKLSLAGLRMNFGQYTESEQLFNEAIQESRLRLGDRHPDYATAISNRALLYIETGRYDEAINDLKHAETLLTATYGKEQYELAYIYANMSNAYRHSGMFKEAEHFALLSAEVTGNSLGKEHPDYATSLQNIAVMYYEFGSYEKAEEIYNKAQGIYLASFDSKHPLLLSLYSNKGAMYIAALQQANTDEKRKEIYEAAYESLRYVTDQYGITNNHLEGKDSLPVLDPDAATHFNNLAELYRITGQNENALQWYKISLNLEKKNFGENHERIAITLGNMALAHSAMDNHPLAIRLATKSLKIKQELNPLHPEKNAISWHGLATIYQESGYIQKADSVHCIAVDLTFKLIERNFIFLSRSQRSDYLKSSEDMINAYSLFVYKYGKNNSKMNGQIWNYTARHKGILLRSDASFNAAVSSASIKNPQLSNLYKEYKIMGEILLNDPSDSELNENFSRIEKQILSEIGNITSVKVPQWQEISQTLTAGTSLVEIIRTIDINTDSVYYSAIIIRTGSEPIRVELFEENKLLGELNNIAGDDKTRVEFLYSTEKANSKVNLWKRLWAPIEAQLKNQTTVFLNPTGIYHQIPIHALKDTTGRTPENKYIVRITHQGIPESKITKPSYAYVMGGARYSFEKTNEFWSYLPGTLSESIVVEKKLIEAGVKVQQDTGIYATEQRFREWANKKETQIWHLATHGFFYQNPNSIEEQPDEEVNSTDLAFRGGSRGMYQFTQKKDAMQRSGIICAGVNNALNNEQTTASTDGVLTAAEVEWLPLQNTELVVLSACQTGLGDLAGNEGVYGLQRAFKIAGAKKLIMSLWQVPDEETKEFFETFYTHYAKTGDAAASIMNARGILSKKYSPYYWAAFVLIE
jgi:tetratricopeptide (TPR) repeat protein/CHAT domain-containing protein